MRRALLLDYGGVLTASVGKMFRTFEDTEGLEKGIIFQALAEAYGDGGEDTEIGRIERGELELALFEKQLAEKFSALGYDVAAEGLVARLFAGLSPSGRMWEATRLARQAGIATALLSNSWSTDGYDYDLLEQHFDEVVISADVGLRKPDPAIFRLAADRLGVAVEDCVFVDDLDLNVAAAQRLGMAAVHHTGDEEAVLAELRDHLGVDLTAAQPLSPD